MVYIDGYARIVNLVAVPWKVISCRRWVEMPVRRLASCSSLIHWISFALPRPSLLCYDGCPSVQRVRGTCRVHDSVLRSEYTCSEGQVSRTYHLHAHSLESCLLFLSSIQCGSDSYTRQFRHRSFLGSHPPSNGLLPLMVLTCVLLGIFFCYKENI
jgi:hypothetical protein